MAPAMPARCNSCGHTFQGGIDIGTATNLRMGQNTTSCPRCGSNAHLIEGTMNVADGAIEMLSGPQWSWDLIDELRLTLRRIVENSPAEPISPVRQIAPALARDVETVRDARGMTTRQVIELLAEILTVLTGVGYMVENADQIYDLMQRVASVIASRYGAG